MKRTSPLLVAIVAAFGAPIGFVLDFVLVSNGGSVYAVPWSFTVTLIAVAVVTVGLGVGVRRSLTPRSAFRELRGSAVSILRAVKAIAVAGAFEAGYLLGFVVFMLTRPVVPEFAVPPAIAGTVASVVLVVAAIIAERFCEVPPTDSDTDGSGSTAPGTEPAC